jgi:hypothetical protein
LIDLAMESDYSSEQRLAVIHDLLQTEAKHLRARLDILCDGRS